MMSPCMLNSLHDALLSAKMSVPSRPSLINYFSALRLQFGDAATGSLPQAHQSHTKQIYPDILRNLAKSGIKLGVKITDFLAVRLTKDFQTREAFELQADELQDVFLNTRGISEESQLVSHRAHLCVSMLQTSHREPTEAEHKVFVACSSSMVWRQSLTACIDGRK